MSVPAAGRWLRRARPLLGTLVEVGVRAGGGDNAALEAAFAAVLEAQRHMSRFDPASDVSRFHRLECGHSLSVHPMTREVLATASELHAATEGAFDISLGTAPQGWHLEGTILRKLSAQVRLDLGGIAKGHAVDLAVQALIDGACTAGWVNAGGDLRAFGDLVLPVQLRDEGSGGVRPFAWMQDGALATSCFDPASRSRLAAGPRAGHRSAHVSVCAPRCLWADALTKVVALSANPSHPLLARYGATAWTHRSA